MPLSGGDLNIPETGDGDGSGGALWGSIIGVPEPVQKFAAAPAGFIVGALLDTLLGGVETIVTAFLDAVLFVFEGSEVGSTDGFWGIADIPRYAASLLGDVFGVAGTSLITAVGGLFATFQGAASAAGPFAPLLAGVTMGGIIIVAGYGAQAVWTLAKDSINPL